MSRLTACCVLLLLLAPAGVAQDTERWEGVQVLRLSHAESTALEQRIAAENGRRLGLPELPPVTPDSPRHSLLFADRWPSVPPAEAGVGEGEMPVIETAIIPPGAGGTGTTFQEIFKFQIPVGYDPAGPPVPLVLAYHGYGAPAGSVDLKSTIDEECNERGWIYVSPTGLDDKLWASPISQQHVDAVLGYMLDTYNVDEDRIYAVGFSMGGGYVTNYAARHRDPEGIMIAAVGTVSAALDWTMVYSTSGAVVQSFMQVPQNFGGNPVQEPFAYQASSALHYMPMSYPPLPGVLFELFSMARNNIHLPAYQTYDSGEFVATVLETNAGLTSLLGTFGPQVELSVVSGTVDGEGDPDPHSWTVLDEDALFDFFEQHAVERYPTTFRAMLPESGPVAWLDATRRFATKFVHLEAEADPGQPRLAVQEIYGAAGVEIDASLAGITGTDPVRVDLSVADSLATRITLRGFATRPSYLVDAKTGELLAGVDSLPAEDALELTLQGPGSLSLDLIQDPQWASTLTSTPNPVQTGSNATIDIDGPPAADTLVLIVAFEEQLYTAKGVTLGALAVSPAKILFFNNPDVEGDVALPISVPDDAGLVGLRLILQSVALDGSNQALEVSNMWAVEID